MNGTFRSLRSRNYRLWAAGALVSNVGTWMQRLAQDWLVLTVLTPRNATAVGIAMGLQFGPQLVLLPFTGYVADRFDRRRMLFATQAAMGLLSLALGILTVTGIVRLWEVYAFSLVFGIVSAFDSPLRQTFVAELVDETHLANAVALNSTSFNAARLVGPAIAGLLIAAIGSGGVFLVNAATFGAVLAALALLRTADLQPRTRTGRAVGGFAEGVRYVWDRPDLFAVLLMLSVIGAFGLNFSIFVSTMTVREFRGDASRYGFLTSMLAIGSIAGALLAARRDEPRLGFLLASAGAFGISLALSAVAPHQAFFGIALFFVGLSAQTFTTTANSALQLWSDPAMRGRVIALFLAIAFGTTPIGAPAVGWVADRFGPRLAIAVGAASGFVALLLGIQHLARHRRLRARLESGHFHLDVDETHEDVRHPDQRIDE